MSRFRGQYYHTIDDKGRVIFPSRYREIFAEEYDNKLVITKWGGYLVVFPFPEWDVIEETMAQQSILKKEIRNFQRFFMSGAIDCSFDNQGRILIPQNLREYAHLEKDIVIVGMVRSIEIWNRERFEDDTRHTGENLDSCEDSVVELIKI